jgi:hypothetical protein
LAECLDRERIFSETSDAIESSIFPLRDGSDPGDRG